MPRREEKQEKIIGRSGSVIAAAARGRKVPPTEQEMELRDRQASVRLVSRWKEGLAKVRFLYRARDGKLWGVPKLRQGERPEDYVERKPLNARAWFIRQLWEMREEADGFAGDESNHWLCVCGALEALIGEASDRALRQAVQRFHGYELDAKMPEEDEFYPQSWMQIEDETGTCEWLRDSDQRIATSLFLSSCGVEKPREAGDWVAVPAKGAKS